MYLTNLIDSLLSFLFGSSTELTCALVIIMICDYLTGVCVAIHQKKLSSKIGFSGICKKVIIIFVVSASHAADKFLFDSGTSFQTVTCIFYLSNECMSILENAGKIGIPLPSTFQKVLSKFREDGK